MQSNSSKTTVIAFELEKNQPNTVSVKSNANHILIYRTVNTDKCAILAVPARERDGGMFEMFPSNANASDTGFGSIVCSWCGGMQ